MNLNSKTLSELEPDSKLSRLTDINKGQEFNKNDLEI